MLLPLLLALTAPPFEYRGTLPPGQTVTIRDINGPVTVREGAGFSVHATRTAQRSDPNEVRVRVDRDARGVFVCVRYPEQADVPCTSSATAENTGNRDVVVTIDVTVPRGAPVDAATVNGTVDVTGHEIRRAVTVNGSVRVHPLAPARGALAAKTVNGSIHVTLPPGAGYALEARTVNGEIDAAGVPVQRSFGPMRRANGTVGDGALRLDLRTVNGAITVGR